MFEYYWIKNRACTIELGQALFLCHTEMSRNFKVDDRLAGRPRIDGCLYRMKDM